MFRPVLGWFLVFLNRSSSQASATRRQGECDAKTVPSEACKQYKLTEIFVFGGAVVKCLVLIFLMNVTMFICIKFCLSHDGLCLHDVRIIEVWSRAHKHLHELPNWSFLQSRSGWCFQNVPTLGYKHHGIRKLEQIAKMQSA
jgi:hypothetical protein